MMVSFTARRSKAEMVTPARATPRETMPLSDLDDDWDLRFLQSCVEFFSPVGGRGDDDGGHGRHNPAEAIKEALAEALVHYYPIAGRLRELPEGRLVVDCTGEGVVFVEAKADVRLVELGEPPVPPFPCAEEFLCDVGDAGDIIGSPLFFIQVECVCYINF
ncbi:hypothetical protein E2562_025276 [Oryza meyeriana var. granulata]|uniref:Uncharacterized protein n=1 Tax=Oryza meyeriana var. granulata TaxID=110450 RepID=A0A6G1BNB9_9ORYZ|nr:hypothetical protein E2562_025276 [Oryza meyeriana var. granulata]